MVREDGLRHVHGAGEEEIKSTRNATYSPDLERDVKLPISFDFSP